LHEKKSSPAAYPYFNRSNLCQRNSSQDIWRQYVLQRNKSIPVWGWADSNEKVIVRLIIKPNPLPPIKMEPGRSTLTKNWQVALISLW